MSKILICSSSAPERIDDPEDAGVKRCASLLMAHSGIDNQFRVVMISIEPDVFVADLIENDIEATFEDERTLSLDGRRLPKFLVDDSSQTEVALLPLPQQ